jgi:hypothetical protein
MVDPVSLTERRISRTTIHENCEVIIATFKTLLTLFPDSVNGGEIKNSRLGVSFRQIVENQYGLFREWAAHYRALEQGPEYLDSCIDNIAEGRQVKQTLSRVLEDLLLCLRLCESHPFLT